MPVTSRDKRVNAAYPSWLEYVVIWGVLLCLTGGQALILSSYTELAALDIPLSFILANIGYWGLMSLVFCLITRYMRRKHFERPMRRLADAARQVAEGDFSVYLAPLRKDGKKDYVDVAFDDFNSMIAELGTIETMKTSFISDVSHEIKTPLSVIQNYAAALRGKGIRPEQRLEYAETIAAAAEKLNTLVANILRLSKLENQHIVPDPEEYDLCGQLAACALAFEGQLEAKGLELRVDMDDRAVIRADRGMLEIVWNNLLANAIKFTDPGGTIMLAQSSDADSVTVRVQDTGQGMGQATLGRIFDKFYQGDASRSGEGNGLGLALALRVVELLGGQISVASEPGQGSSFTVTLNTTN